MKNRYYNYFIYICILERKNKRKTKLLDTNKFKTYVYRNNYTCYSSYTKNIFLNVYSQISCFQ